MIRAFKSFSSRRINEFIKSDNWQRNGLRPFRTINPDENIDKFQWHKSFYDHIIRNEKSYLKIKNYINWEKDTNYINYEK